MHDWLRSVSMPKVRKRIPAEAFPPGEFIQEELEARGWTQQLLAEKAGLPESTIERIIRAEKTVTLADARGLSRAFGTSAEIWVNLQKIYNEWRKATSKLPPVMVASRARSAPKRKRTSKTAAGD